MRSRLPLIGGDVSGEPGLHRLEFRRPFSEFLLAVQEFECLLLNDFHTPLDITFRFVRLRPDLRRLGLRLSKERALPFEILLARRKLLLSPSEILFAFIEMDLPVSNPVLSVQQLDCPALKELPLSGNLRFLALHRLPDLVRCFLRGAVGRYQALLGDRCEDRKSTRLNSSHLVISYAVFCLKKKKN